MTTPLGDVPDWQTEVTPQINSAAAANIGPNNIQQLLQAAQPYRIWGVWISISIASGSTYNLGVNTVGAQIGDGSGKPLLRVQLHIATANQTGASALAIPLQGYTPVLSAGFYTTNLVTDAGFTGIFFRANGGILYSQP